MYSYMISKLNTSLFEVCANIQDQNGFELIRLINDHMDRIPDNAPFHFGIQLQDTIRTKEGALKVCKTIVELSGWTPFITKLEDTLGLDRYTANFPPMLAILFIGVRMHALQIGPKLDSPQRWAQACFYGCIASVCVLTLSAILLPFCVECECKESDVDSDA